MKKGNANSKMVSIIMPVYNCEKTVSKSIESVLSQDYKDYELIIINDGSKDNTQQVCESFKDNRIKVFYQKNSGPSSARNLGIDKSNSKYIMFIDADDEYMENTLSKMVEAIERYECDLVTGNFIINGSDFEKRESYSKKFEYVNEYIDFLIKNNICNSNWNKIYRMDIIEKNNLRFNVNYNVGEDLRFNFYYFSHITNGYHLDENIYKYTLSSSGLTLSNSNTKPMIEVDLLKMMFEFYKNHNFDLKTVSWKIAKDFFYIDNVDFILSSDMYLELLKSAKNYSFYARLLYFLVKKKCRKALSILLKLRGMVRR